jgi:SAM-dependent methyltransferase
MPAYDEQFHKQIEGSSYGSAKAVIGILSPMLRPASVVDVGCGTGTWLSVWGEHGVDDVLGIDGDYVDRAWLKIPHDRFMARDLNEPLSLGRTFDLAMTLEVAEHIAPERADQFVASMARLAPVVLFSAAIPHQGGVHHVNEQWPGYWAGRFERHGYLAVDCVRPRIWGDDNVSVAYRQNILLFVRNDVLDRNDALRRERDTTRADQLTVVHPASYLGMVNRMNADIPLRRLVGALPRSAWVALQRRLKAARTRFTSGA